MVASLSEENCIHQPLRGDVATSAQTHLQHIDYEVLRLLSQDNRSRMLLKDKLVQEMSNLKQQFA
jgi:hypothetical protein